MYKAPTGNITPYRGKNEFKTDAIKSEDEEEVPKPEEVKDDEIKSE
jgi:hypothetical protein